MAKISIYNKDGTDFSHNGIILKDTTECIVEEELNGKYLLELSYPVFGNDKHLLLKEENIIKADGQLFRIHSSISNLGYIEVKARHIFYDLLHNFLEDVRPTDLNGNNALNWILDNTQYPHKFRGVSDVSTINTQYYIRKNPVEAILGSDSLSARWGGELVRDNFTIKLLRSRGANKGAQIAYGKNLMGLEVEKDMDSVATRIMPVGNDGLLLPEKYIDSPLIDNYNQPYIKKVEIDIGVEEATDDKEGVTQEEAFDIMRQKVSDLYEFDKVDIPYVNIKADLALLENTEEYKHLKHLVKVELGDIVSCTDNPLNIEFEAKVIRVKKDVLSNKNVEVELGQFKKGLSDTIKDVLDKVKEEIEIKKSDLEKAIENATDLITSALGGYVVKRAGEILIMDEEDPLVATRVWRWNLNGLGYSSNGVNGPYRLAMTMDGSIVADFITTGVLNASLLKTGLIKPQVGDDFINMENGHFKLGGMEQDSEGFRIKIGTKPIGDFVDDEISTVVDYMEESMNVRFSGIHMAIDDITIEVGEKIGADEVVSSINVQPSSVKIDTKNLDLSGNLNLSGVFTNYDSYSNHKAVELKDSKLMFFDYDGSGSTSPVGHVFSSQSAGTTDRVGLAMVGTTGGGIHYPVSIGYHVQGNQYADYVTFDKSDTYPVQFKEVIRAYQNLYLNASRSAFFGSGGSQINEVNNRINVRGPNTYGARIGTASNSNWIDVFPGTAGSYPIALRANTYIGGDLQVTGVTTKTSAISTMTRSFGEIETTAQEVTEPFVADIGSGTINSDGECLIYIDDILAEVGNTKINYHIFTQKYNGNINEIVKKETHFIVYGDVGTEFSWELKVKKRDAELKRLEISDTDSQVIPASFEDDFEKDNTEETTEILNRTLDFSVTNILI